MTITQRSRAGTSFPSGFECSRRATLACTFQNQRNALTAHDGESDGSSWRCLMRKVVDCETLLLDWASRDPCCGLLCRGGAGPPVLKDATPVLKELILTVL